MQDSKKLTDIVEICNTIQGEGPNAGMYTTLMRFKKCNLRCEFPIKGTLEKCVCDTQDKMNKNPLEITLRDIKDAVLETGNMMITGGEPTLYVDEIVEIIKYLIRSNVRVKNIDIETNGHKLDLLNYAIASEQLDKDISITYVYSPKIQTDTLFKQNAGKLSSLLKIDNVILKIVAFDHDIVSDFMELIPEHDLQDRVWIMPVGTNMEEQNKYFKVAYNLIEKYKVKFSPRIHLFYDFSWEEQPHLSEKVA